MIGVNGFGLSNEVRQQIREIDLTRWSTDRSVTVDVVVSAESDEWSALGDHLRNHAGNGEYSVVPSVGDWGEADEFGSALIPQQIIRLTA